MRHNVRVRPSLRAEYALRAVFELAAAGPALVTTDQIARAQLVPGKFLEAILTQLRRAGLVASQRGPDGGFRLARPVSEISLADVIRAVDGPRVGGPGLRPDGAAGLADPSAGTTAGSDSGTRGTAGRPARWQVPLNAGGGVAGASGLCVVVRAQTGAVYRQHYGGIARRQGQVEGFLIPASGPAGLSQLRELFEGHFRGAGTRGHSWQAGEAERLRRAVRAVRCPAPGHSGAAAASPLELDEQRLSEADEGWVPVRAPYGPGVPLWPGSDLQ